MLDLQRLILPGALLIPTLVFGFWLSRAGRPYNQVLFNLHKLIALAGVVMIVVRMLKTLQQPSGFLLGALVLMAACTVVLFTTGGLMSAGKFEHLWLHRGHQAAVAGLVLGAGGLIAVLGSFL